MGKNRKDIILPRVCESGNKYKVMSVDGTLYLLEADRNRHEVWELDSDGNIKEKLGRFDSVWPGLLKAPDAGFTWTNGLTYLFQGSQYYRFRNKTLEGGFPKRISQGFSGIPAYLAAAVVHNEKIYFLKKSRYYIFSPSVSPPVRDAEKLPDGISDVMSGFQMDNKIYIFSKEKYWRMNSSFSVDKKAFPRYPRLIMEYWGTGFGCAPVQ